MAKILEGATPCSVFRLLPLSLPNTGPADILSSDPFSGIMSGQSESHFELGYAVNVDSHLNLLKTARASVKPGRPLPVYVFVSSLAVYGGPKCTPESHVIPA